MYREVENKIFIPTDYIYHTFALLSISAFLYLSTTDLGFYGALYILPLSALVASAVAVNDIWSPFTETLAKRVSTGMITTTVLCFLYFGADSVERAVILSLASIYSLCIIVVVLRALKGK